MLKKSKLIETEEKKTTRGITFPKQDHNIQIFLQFFLQFCMQPSMPQTKNKRNEHFTSVSMKVYLFSDSRRGTFNQFFNVSNKIISQANQKQFFEVKRGRREIKCYKPWLSNKCDQGKSKQG